MQKKIVDSLEKFICYGNYFKKEDLKNDFDIINKIYNREIEHDIMKTFITTFPYKTNCVHTKLDSAYYSIPYKFYKLFSVINLETYSKYTYYINAFKYFLIAAHWNIDMQKYFESQIIKNNSIILNDPILKELILYNIFNSMKMAGILSYIAKTTLLFEDIHMYIKHSQLLSYLIKNPNQQNLYTLIQNNMKNSIHSDYYYEIIHNCYFNKNIIKYINLFNKIDESLYWIYQLIEKKGGYLENRIKKHILTSTNLNWNQIFEKISVFSISTTTLEYIIEHIDTTKLNINCIEKLFKFIRYIPKNIDDYFILNDKCLIELNNLKKCAKETSVKHYYYDDSDSDNDNYDNDSTIFIKKVCYFKNIHNSVDMYSLLGKLPMTKQILDIALKYHQYDIIEDAVNTSFIDNLCISTLYNSYVYYEYPTINNDYNDGLKILHLLLLNINNIDLELICKNLKKIKEGNIDYLNQFINIILEFSPNQVSYNIIALLNKVGIAVCDLSRFNLTYGKELYDACFSNKGGIHIYYLEKFNHVPKNIIIMRELPRIRYYGEYYIKTFFDIKISRYHGVTKTQAEIFIKNNNLQYDGYFLQNYNIYYNCAHKISFTPYQDTLDKVYQN